MSKLSWPRIGLILAGLIPACALMAQGPPSDATGNGDALRILVTVLSILSGFLIATITMMGDPSSLFPGSWRVANAHSRQIRRSLGRFTVLFYVYLIAILIAVAGTMLKGQLCPSISAWLRHGALCVGIAAIIWSFGLPITILRGQQSRLDKRVAERRNSTKEHVIEKP